jgi:hypothetical protein
MMKRILTLISVFIFVSLIFAGDGTILTATWTGPATGYAGIYTVTSMDEMTYGGGPGEGVYIGLTVSGIGSGRWCVTGVINGYNAFDNYNIYSNGYVGGFHAEVGDEVAVLIYPYPEGSHSGTPSVVASY